MRDEFGEFDLAVVIGVAIRQGIENSIGEHAMPLARSGNDALVGELSDGRSREHGAAGGFMQPTHAGLRCRLLRA